MQQIPNTICIKFELNDGDNKLAECRFLTGLDRKNQKVVNTITKTPEIMGIQLSKSDNMYQKTNGVVWVNFKSNDDTYTLSEAWKLPVYNMPNTLNFRDLNIKLVAVCEVYLGVDMSPLAFVNKYSNKSEDMGKTEYIKRYEDVHNSQARQSVSQESYKLGVDAVAAKQIQNYRGDCCYGAVDGGNNVPSTVETSAVSDNQCDVDIVYNGGNGYVIDNLDTDITCVGGAVQEVSNGATECQNNMYTGALENEETTLDNNEDQITYTALTNTRNDTQLNNEDCCDTNLYNVIGKVMFNDYIDINLKNSIDTNLGM